MSWMPKGHKSKLMKKELLKKLTRAESEPVTLDKFFRADKDSGEKQALDFLLTRTGFTDDFLLQTDASAGAGGQLDTRTRFADTKHSWMRRR